MPYDTSMGALIRDAARVSTSAEQFEQVVEAVVKADGRVSDGHKYEVDPASLIAARATAFAACELLEDAMRQMDEAVDYGHWTMDDIIEWMDYDPDEDTEESDGLITLCECCQCDHVRAEMSADYDEELSDGWW